MLAPSGLVRLSGAYRCMISAICKGARRGQGKYVLSKLMTASSHMTKYGRTLEEASGLDHGVGELDATVTIPTEEVLTRPITYDSGR
jgi:hypothetical protein